MNISGKLCHYSTKISILAKRQIYACMDAENTLTCSLQLQKKKKAIILFIFGIVLKTLPKRFVYFYIRPVKPSTIINTNVFSAVTTV